MRVRDKDMAVEIIMESMAVMTAKNSLSPKWREKDQSDPETLVFVGDGALVYENLCASGNRVFYVYKESRKTTRRGKLRGSKGHVPRGLRCWSCGVGHLEPRRSYGLLLRLKLLL
jgi:hypothetical protein